MAMDHGRAALRAVITAAIAGCFCLTATPMLAQRVVFGTSVSGTGKLGDWVDAGGLSGLAAGDAICRARAAAAGLANPQNFVAWLSGTSDDAYCRLHGLTGTMAANCGQPSLPAAAGPWVRTDGFPFGEDVTQLLSPNGVVYSSLRWDEFGDPLPEPPYLSGPVVGSFFTATHPRGWLSQGSCDNWTTASATWVLGGSTYQTSDGWTAGVSMMCNEEARLICMERLAGPALPPVTVSGRPAFVTSAGGNGDLGSWPEADPGTLGVAAGDSICRNLAAAAGFEEAGAFKAWLSDSSMDAIDRFTEDSPWVRTDGFLVATSKADLTDGTLHTSINVTEKGTYIGNFGVWTGTSDLGVALPDHCSDWTRGTDTESGRDGRANSVGFAWSGGRPEVGAPGTSPAKCNRAANRLFCLFDVSGTIFTEGFESGVE